MLNICLGIISETNNSQVCFGLDLAFKAVTKIQALFHFFLLYTWNLAFSLSVKFCYWLLYP